MKTERSISAGRSCFLVKDESLLKGWGSPVYAWLYDHGFVSWGVKGVYPGVDWVFVNPYSKVFAPGLRGYAVTRVVCDHAVTFEEFKTIYDIFDRYKELHVSEWKRDYIDENILDGEPWSLELYFSNGWKPMNFSGCNAYPFSFGRLVEMFEDIVLIEDKQLPEQY